MEPFIFREPFTCGLEIPARLTISKANKGMTDAMKEKTEHSR